MRARISVVCMLFLVAAGTPSYGSAGALRVEFSAHHVTVEGKVTVGTPPTTQPVGDGGRPVEGPSVSLLIENISLAVEIGVDGTFVDGFDDDTITFSLCVPAEVSFALQPACSGQATLTLVPGNESTSITFSGPFLVGMSVLRAAGLIYLDVPVETEGFRSVASGEIVEYLGERYRVRLGQPFLEVAGIQVVALPDCVE